MSKVISGCSECKDFEIPDFDELGLYSHESVWFWESGDFVETAKVFNEFEVTFGVQDLDKIIH